MEINTTKWISLNELENNSVQVDYLEEVRQLAKEARNLI